MIRSGVPADECAVTGAAQKSCLDQLLDDEARLIGVEIPQALKLPVRESQSGALVELAANPPKHDLEAGHVGQWGRALQWCGEQNAR